MMFGSIENVMKIGGIRFDNGNAPNGCTVGRPGGLRLDEIFLEIKKDASSANGGINWVP